MQEKVWFEDSEGYRLCGILSDSSGDKNKPIIILVHGLSSNKGRETFTLLESRLNEKGFPTFRIDLFAHGESEGKFEDLTISRASDGIFKAMDFVRQRGYKEIGLMGSSFGGIASIMVASGNPWLHLLVLKCPVSNYPEKIRMFGTNMEDDLDEWKEKGYTVYHNSKGETFRLNYSFVEDFEKNNGYEAAKKIKIPVFIIHGDADKNVPVEQSKKIAGILEDCKLEIVPGANHFFSGEGQAEKMVDSIVNFIVEKS